MQDYLVRATAAEGNIRMFAATSTATVTDAAKRHAMSPTATAALGRTLTATAFLAVELKHATDSVTVRILGDGPLGAIVTAGTAAGEVRGYVHNPGADLPIKSNGKLDVAGIVGQRGELHVTKDLGLKAPYTGTVPLVSGEIAEDFTRYFAESEQAPTSVSLGVLLDRYTNVRAAGGFVVQLLPGAGEELTRALEETLAGVEPVSTMVDRGLSPEDMIQNILAGWRPVIGDKRPIVFRCNCSETRLEQVLISLGRKQLEELAVEGQAELCCHFCAEKYLFSAQRLKRLLAEI